MKQNNDTTLAISLISHTNVGKTTLARTLLRRDIGKVEDKAHVTDISEAHELLRTEKGEVLLLWDTPGFGDSVRLMKRLERAGDPIGWFLGSVWDRFSDRPFWCSQQAVKNIQSEADVVLFLVNATEDPETAAYVKPELDVVEWLGKPVVALVNQTGPQASTAVDEGVARWQAFFQRLPFVHFCLPLDAFARCWIQELTLFERIAEATPHAKRRLAERLTEEWARNSLKAFEESMESMARQLVTAAADEVIIERVSVAGRLREFVARAGLGSGDRAASERDQAMADLAKRLDESIRASTRELIHIHGLEGEAAGTILQRIRENYSTREPIPEGIAAVLGGFFSGALGGLAADLAAGGLTFGGGAVAGGLIGAAGAGSLAKGYNLIRGQAEMSVKWTESFLIGLVQSAALRYLAVAHYGRGRGPWVESEAPVHWKDIVHEEMEDHKQSLRAAFREARKDNPGKAQAQLARELRAICRTILLRLYPNAKLR